MNQSKPFRFICLRGTSSFDAAGGIGPFADPLPDFFCGGGAFPLGDGFLAAAAGGPEKNKQLAFFLNPKIVNILCHLFLQRRLSSVLVLKAVKFVYSKSRSFVHLFLSRRFSLTISLTRALPLLPVVRPLPMFVALAPLLRLWAEKRNEFICEKRG